MPSNIYTLLQQNIQVVTSDQVELPSSSYLWIAVGVTVLLCVLSLALIKVLEPQFPKLINGLVRILGIACVAFLLVSTANDLFLIFDVPILRLPASIVFALALLVSVAFSLFGNRTRTGAV